MSTIDVAEITALYARLLREAAEGGYRLNPDEEFVRELVAGLIANEKRYGYQACPCRLASGDRAKDLDIICPCDYRDPDLEEFGTCYCALYVSDEVVRGEKAVSSIPERRPVGGPKAEVHEYEEVKIAELPFPVWRCKVCGYLCARPQPPLICPVCKVTRDRFERFM